MEPVLILIDNDTIRQEKAGLNNCIPLMQTLFNAFASINISVTIQDLANFKHWFTYNNNARRDFLEDFVISQLAAQSGGYTRGDVALKEDELKRMIALPDLTAVRTALKIFSEQTGSIRLNLLVLANNTISKISDADAQITTEYTYFTKTDLSAQLATDLLAVAQLLQTAKGKYNSHAIAISVPNGLVFRGDSIGLDLKVIRGFEGFMVSQ